MRTLNPAEEEIRVRLRELQLFVAEKARSGQVSEYEKTGKLIFDLQLLVHIWTKDDGVM